MDSLTNQNEIPKKPFFFMLVGLPGSGKSYTAQRLVERWSKESRSPMMHLSSDAYIEAAAKRQGLTYNEVFASAISKATFIFLERCKHLLSQGADMVIDKTNLTIESRAKLLEMVPKHYQKIAVVVEVHEDLRRARMEARLDKLIPAEADIGMRARYVPPTEAEGFDLVISSDML